MPRPAPTGLKNTKEAAKRSSKQYDKQLRQKRAEAKDFCNDLFTQQSKGKPVAAAVATKTPTKRPAINKGRGHVPVKKKKSSTKPTKPPTPTQESETEDESVASPPRHQKRNVSPENQEREDYESDEDQPAADVDEEPVDNNNNHHQSSEDEDSDTGETNSPSPTPKTMPRGTKNSSGGRDNTTSTKKIAKASRKKSRRGDDSDSEDDVSDYEAQIRQLKRELAEKNAALQNSTNIEVPLGKMVSDSNRKKCINNAMESLVKKQVINVWRLHNFINTEEELVKLAEEVLHNSGLTGYYPTKHMDPATRRAVNLKRAEWINLYKEVLREQINEKRSYVQNQARTRVFEFMDGTYKPEYDEDNKLIPRELPSVSTMKRVIMRDLDEYAKDDEGNILVDDDGVQILDEQKTKYLKLVFEWYVTQLLPCFTGNKWFGHEDLHKGCVSTLPTKFDPNELRVPSSTEAFVLVAYENCFRRWKFLQEWRHKPENEDKQVPKYCPQKEGMEWTKVLKGKFSDGASGQSRFGGWSIKGRNKYAKLTTEIAINRETNKDVIEAVETVIVDDAKAVKARNKKRKASNLETEDPNEDSDEEELVTVDPKYLGK